VLLDELGLDAREMRAADDDDRGLVVGVIGKRQDPTEIPGPDDVAGRHH